MNVRKDILKLIDRCKNLEGKLDLLDTMICLTVDPEIVDICNEIIRELTEAEIYSWEEVV